MKRPSFQFYPADWRKDPALSSCSLAARGLWIELMCIAHESDQYGVLTVNGKPMSNAQIARMVGESPRSLDRLLAELEGAGVFSRGEDGAIFSRRMIKDEALRNVRAEAGKKGGNPALLVKKDNRLLKQTYKQNQTPSSSSSTSNNSLSHDDRLNLPGLSDHHPIEWQPDPLRLANELQRQGLPMPAPESLSRSLRRFNAHNEGKALTENLRYSKLATWLEGDLRREQTRPVVVPVAAGAAAPRKLTPLEQVRAARERELGAR